MPTSSMIIILPKMAETYKREKELKLYESEYARAKKMLEADCRKGSGMNRSGNQIVFFLGAGINGKEMLWDNIIKNPLDKALKRFCNEHGIGEIILDNREWTNTMQATIVKHVSKTAYINQLRDFIYSKGPTKSAIAKYIEDAENDRECDDNLYTLYAMAKIIVENRNIVAVVTQNYDKFLTYAISEYAKRKGIIIRCEEIYGSKYGDVSEAKWRYLTDYANEGNKDERVLPILHVHGYLAPYDELQNSLKGDEIVMTDDEFYTLAKDNYSWITTSQLHYLNHYTCVFAGLSLTDQTSQRMLHFVKRNGDMTHNRYYLMACCPEDDIQQFRMHFLKSSIYKELGMTTVMTIKGYKQLYKDIIECMTNK